MALKTKKVIKKKARKKGSGLNRPDYARKPKVSKKKPAKRKPTKTLKVKAKKTPRKKGNPPFYKNLTPEKILKAIYAKFGIVTDVAEACKVSRVTVHQWKREHEWVKEAFVDASEAMLDLGESRLIQKVQRNSLGAICFMVKCRGKDRGYIESLQLGGRLGHDISVDIGTGLSAPAMEDIN